MARALPVDGRIYTIEKSTKHAEIASSFFEQSEIGYKIELMVGDAHALFSSLPQVDMVFIDADKESYPAYLDWAEANIKPGGLIVADNTFLFDTVFEEQPLEKIRPAMWEAMREFNQRLADTTKFESTMIPTNEGLSIAIKC
jgi:predicted O-methyltransferase YrrM